MEIVSVKTSRLYGGVPRHGLTMLLPAHTSKLATSEQALVRHDGCLLILARSGCGKTLVVQERISHIIQMSDPRQPEPRQLFIARSTPLCKQVSEKERKKNKSD